MFDNVFRVFMYVMPYAVCIAAYVWVGRKALRVPQPVARIGALAMVAGGLGYTAYSLLRSVAGVFTNDNFEYVVLLVMVPVLAVASIIMAIGEPEEGDRKADEQGVAKAQENGKGMDVDSRL